MKNTKDKIFVVASAGGHLTQAFCAISQCDGIILFTNAKNVSNDRIEKVHAVVDTQFNPFYHFINFILALFYILYYKPKCTISTGGPKALAFALAAKILRSKFVYLDTLSRVKELSNTASFIHKYNLSDEMYCQWESLAEEKNIKYIGKCFDILNEQIDENEKFHVTEAPQIFVTLGTSEYKFDRLFEAISKLSIYQDKRVKWIIQTGKNPVTHLPANGEVHDMLPRPQVEDIVKNSSLVISHCGVGSINLVLSYSKKTIFFPRIAKFDEFSDDHQLQIAKEIRNVTFDVIFPDDELKDISYEELCSYKIFDNKRDVTNIEFAKKMQLILNS